MSFLFELSCEEDRLGCLKTVPQCFKTKNILFHWLGGVETNKAIGNAFANFGRITFY
jgi:hypothetical protein